MTEYDLEGEEQFSSGGFMSEGWLKFFAFVLICVGFYSVYETFFENIKTLKLPDYSENWFAFKLAVYPWISMCRAAICFLTSALLLKQTRKEK